VSTKISRGARLHLLRVVERLQYPMRVVRVGAYAQDPLTIAAVRRVCEKAKATGAVFAFPPWVEMTFAIPRVRP
jgi:hypothetical protein